MGGGKAASKAAKKEKQAVKASRKAHKGASDEEETPIAEIIRQLEQKTTATATVVTASAPSARSSFSLISLKGPLFYIFGGEYFDSKVCKVYNELYKWHPLKEEEEWRLIGGTPAPKPRCGHQMVLYQDDLYLFGGEFATTNQFYHFRDTWKFDTKLGAWNEISGTGPSARSGHRMVVCRNVIVLFGGFHDSSRETRYHNDVHLFFPGQNTWRKVTFQSGSGGPTARSGVVMGATNDGVLIHGGYSKAKDTDKGAQGLTYSDSWWLDMSQVFEDPTKGLPQWERLGKRGSPPKRNGSSTVTFKNFVYCFGGVADEDDGGLTLKLSLFYNDIPQFDLNARRWGQFSPRSEATPKLQAGQSHAYLERNGKLWKVLVETASPFAGLDSLKEDDPRVIDSNVRYNLDPKLQVEPLPRMNAAVAVKDNHLYVAYGTLEVGSRTIVLDDCWRVHLNGRSGWECLLSGSYWQKEWQEDVSSAEGSSAESDSGSLYESAVEEDSDSASETETDNNSDTPAETNNSERHRLLKPGADETLKDYFARTRHLWKETVVHDGLADIAQGEKLIMQSAFKEASEFHRTAAEQRKEFPKRKVRGGQKN